MAPAKGYHTHSIRCVADAGEPSKLHLAPDIQERLLWLPALAQGREVISEKSLRRLVGECDWKRQREYFHKLLRFFAGSPRNTLSETPKKASLVFVWTATVESIVAKLARCRQTLEQIQPGCAAPKSRKRKSS